MCTSLKKKPNRTATLLRTSLKPQSRWRGTRRRPRPRTRPRSRPSPGSRPRRPRARARPSPPHPAAGLLRALRDFLTTASGEFSPWLSWKVYDVLFALTLLVLGRRIKWLRAAQQTLDL